MIGKAVRLFLIISIAGGVPYAWFSDGPPRAVRQKFRSAWTALRNTVRDQPTTYLVSSNQTRPAESIAGVPGVPTGGTVAALEEVLRFDIDDRWILKRWPRVSTILSDRTRKGLRVPLVTGSSVSDLAGSLSYYFDERGRVRRIEFEGRTGDEQPLVDMLARRFALRREPSLGAGLYLTRWNGLPTNGLRVSHAPVVRDSQPHSQLDVRLELNRPDEGYSLSNEFLQLLFLERKART